MIAPQTGGGGDQYRLESERLRQAGALDLERLKLNNELESQRLRLANDRYNLEQQALARNRALDIANRGSTTGLINQLLKSLESVLRGGKGATGSTGGGEGRSLPTTPNTFPGRPQLPPSYTIPTPNINPFDAYVPSWPPAPEDLPLSVTDWGEAPQFEPSGLGLDSGGSFFDQWAGNWDYSVGFGESFGLDQPYDIYSAQPELTYNDYTGDIGLEDFSYGYGAGEAYSDSGSGDYGFGSDE